MEKGIRLWGEDELVMERTLHLWKGLSICGKDRTVVETDNTFDERKIHLWRGLYNCERGHTLVIRTTQLWKGLHIRGKDYTFVESKIQPWEER